MSSRIRYLVVLIALVPAVTCSGAEGKITSAGDVGVDTNPDGSEAGLRDVDAQDIALPYTECERVPLFELESSFSVHDVEVVDVQMTYTGLPGPHRFESGADYVSLRFPLPSGVSVPFVADTVYRLELLGSVSCSPADGPAHSWLRVFDSANILLWEGGGVHNTKQDTTQLGALLDKPCCSPDGACGITADEAAVDFSVAGQSHTLVPGETTQVSVDDATYVLHVAWTQVQLECSGIVDCGAACGAAYIMRLQ